MKVPQGQTADWYSSISSYAVWTIIQMHPPQICRQHSWYMNGRASVQRDLNKLQAWDNRNLTKFSCSEGQALYPGQDNPGHQCSLGSNPSPLLRRARRTINWTWVNSALSWQIRETTNWAALGLWPEGKSYHIPLLSASVVASWILRVCPSFKPPPSTQNKKNMKKKKRGGLAECGWDVKGLRHMAWG